MDNKIQTILNEKEIKKLMLSTILILLLIDTAYGYAGMGGNTSGEITGDTTQDGLENIDLANTTQSDQNIILIQHLIEVDATQFDAQNRIYVRETLIFKNIGDMNFQGTLRTWVPDGLEGLKVGKVATMTGGSVIPMNAIQSGNVISWQDYIKANDPLPPLYTVEYVLSSEPEGTFSKSKYYSKKLVYPTLINKVPLSVVLKVTKGSGETITLKDELGSSISSSGKPMDEDNSILYTWETPQFKEINVVFTKTQYLTAPTIKEDQINWALIGSAILLIFFGAVLLRSRKPKDDAPREIEKVKSDIHLSDDSNIKLDVKTSHIKPALEILRGYSVLQNNDIKFGIRLINKTGFVVTDADIILDYTKPLFSTQDTEIQHLGNITPNGKRTAIYLLKPLGCIHNEQINAIITYKDHTGKKQTLHMRPKEVHCVCPFLKEKPLSEGEYSRLAAISEFVQEGISFKGIGVEEMAKFMGETCRHMLHNVKEYDIEGKRVIYLSGESVGEKAYYLLTAVIQEYKGLTQVVLRAHSDKKYGLNGFINEMADSLRHLVGSVQNAKEIGIIENTQVINIIDSVVQRTNFEMGEGGNAQVNIKDSMVQRSNIGKNEEE